MRIVGITWIRLEEFNSSRKNNFIVSSIQNFVTSGIVRISEKYAGGCIIAKFSPKGFWNIKINFTTENSDVGIIYFWFCLKVRTGFYYGFLYVVDGFEYNWKCQ